MKKIITRLLILAFTIFFTVYSSLYVFVIPVQAVEGAIAYEVVQFGANNPAIQKILSQALIYGGVGGAFLGAVASPGGASGTAIDYNKAQQILNDFYSDLNSGALENAVLDTVVILQAE